jgi:RNA polymerase sigma factor (sigma-70 family)
VPDEGARIPEKHAAEVERFYEANSRWLYGYARFLTGRDWSPVDRRATAEDLVQEAFSAAACAWGTLRVLAEGQQRAWLRTTVSRMASSVNWRHQKLRDLLPEIYALHTSVPPEPEQQVTSAIMTEKALEKVAEIIDSLPPQQKMIAVLRWTHHMQNTAIAAELGTTPNVVAVQVNAIRSKLINGLGPYYPFARGNEEGGES